MLHEYLTVKGRNIIVIDLETIMYHNAPIDNFVHISKDYYIVPNLDMYDYGAIAELTIDVSLPQEWFNEHRHDREDYVWYYEKGNAFGEPMLKKHVFQVAHNVILAELASALQEENNKAKEQH